VTSVAVGSLAVPAVVAWQGSKNVSKHPADSLGDFSFVRTYLFAPKRLFRSTRAIVAEISARSTFGALGPKKITSA
jgi:hypothetical protein